MLSIHLIKYKVNNQTIKKFTLIKYIKIFKFKLFVKL